MSPLEMAKSSHRPGFALRGRGLRGHSAREAARDLRLPRGAATGLDQAAAGGPADADDAGVWNMGRVGRAPLT